MRRWLLAAHLCFLLLLSGCAGSQKKIYVPRFVTRIQVTASRDSMVSDQTFTDPKSMSAILNYLRLLDPYTAVTIDPSTFRADAFRITVYHSDGSQNIYYQLYDQYLQTDGSGWKKIDPKQGSKLPDILSSIPTQSR